MQNLTREELWTEITLKKITYHHAVLQESREKFELNKFHASKKDPFN
jgi:hypothetical protein